MSNTRKLGSDYLFKFGIHVRKLLSCFFCTLLATAASAQTNPDDDDILLQVVPAIVATKNGATNTGTNPGSLVSLCEGFRVNDRLSRPMQPMARPGPGESYIDRAFGGRVTRISDSSSLASGIVRTLYSTIQSWNADESRMILWHRGDGHYLYHGQTYQLMERLPVTPADIEQLFWSTTNPDLLFYPNRTAGLNVSTQQGSYRLRGNELMSYNVRTRRHALIKDFNNVCTGGDGITAGGDVQMVSYDDDHFGFRCGATGFSYTRSTDTTSVVAVNNDLNAPQSFPSGDRYYHQGKVLNQRLVAQRDLDLANAVEHSSLGQLHNGDDAYYAVAFDPNLRNSCGDGIGSLVVHDATDAGCRVLVGPTNGYPYTLSGTHISALAHQRPGWAAVSSVGYGDEGDSLLEQELYLANTDPTEPQVCRVAHHRSSGRLGSIGYFAEPHPVLSPSGTRMLFNSDWNNSGSVDTYVVELGGF